MIPSAMMLHFMIPPKMLIKIVCTLGCELRISKAVLTCSTFAPPPTSRKLAGSPLEIVFQECVPIELDDIHRGHRQARAVDHAADVSIQGYVVQASSQSQLLVGVNLLARQRVLPELNELFLAEFGVIVDVDFCVDAEKLLLGVGGPGVDFKLRGIELLEKCVEVPHLFSRLLPHFLELEVIDDLIGDFVGEAGVYFQGTHNYALGVGLCDFLDFHSSVDGSHNGRALGVAVENERQVDLSHNVDAFVHENCINLETLERVLRNLTSFGVWWVMRLYPIICLVKLATSEGVLQILTPPLSPLVRWPKISVERYLCLARLHALVPSR